MNCATVGFYRSKSRAAVLRERIVSWLCARLPLDVVYWCHVRVVAYATTGSYSDQDVSALLVQDAAKRWIWRMDGRENDPERLA